MTNPTTVAEARRYAQRAARVGVPVEPRVVEVLLAELARLNAEADMLADALGLLVTWRTPRPCSGPEGTS